MHVACSCQNNALCRHHLQHLHTGFDEATGLDRRRVEGHAGAQAAEQARAEADSSAVGRPPSDRAVGADAQPGVSIARLANQ